MFIFNFKVDGNKFSKILFAMMIVIIIIIFCIGVYSIFFKENASSGSVVKISDDIKSEDIFNVDVSNYTNILQAANDNIDDYIGCKIHFSGYVYRLIDFEENEFVLARDMVISPDKQSLVVGFLCNCDGINEFEDGAWVDVVGEIGKGDFNGEIAIVNVTSIERIEEPRDEEKFVYPPDDTYIPTSNMF
ncbi:MAG: hypothetical protein HFJ17_00745 [Clostridia bacterium]|nr:hypothetical protein [Clostridia bacterium]